MIFNIGKKLIVTLLSGLLVLILLTACNDDTPEGKLGNEPGGTLLVWHPFTDFRLIRESFQEFEKLHPGVKILGQYILETKLLRKFIREEEYGFGPDILMDSSRNIPELVQRGKIQAIPRDVIDRASFTPISWSDVRYRGKIYGWPLSYNLRVLCYNRGKIGQVQEDGSLIKPPGDLEGLIQQARKGYSVGMVSTFEDTFWGTGIFGAEFFDAGGSAEPRTDGWAKWLEWLKKASNEPNFILVRERSILNRAFKEGQLTYYVCDSDEIGEFNTLLGDNLGVATLPAQPGRHATPILYASVIVFNRSSSPRQTLLGQKLAAFMTNPQQQLKGLIQSQQFIPSEKKVEINEKLLPIEAVLQRQSRTAVPIPLDRFQEITNIAREGESLYQKVLSGDITPSSAASQLRRIIPSPP